MEKLDASRCTGPKGLEIAKIETFRDISRNVEIRAIWFPEYEEILRHNQIPIN